MTSVGLHPCAAGGHSVKLPHKWRWILDWDAFQKRGGDTTIEKINRGHCVPDQREVLLDSVGCSTRAPILCAVEVAIWWRYAIDHICKNGMNAATTPRNNFLYLIPGFIGTTNLTATPRRPACPSRASSWSSLTTPWGFPCCVHSPCVHAAATTPAQRLGYSSLVHPAVSAFPERVIGSACALSVSRLAQRLLTLRPAHSRCHRFVTRYPKASDPM
jgi:hypothetical protein